MTEPITPTGAVHWIGAGLSSGSGLKIVRDHAARVVLWNRTEKRARELAARLGLSDEVAIRSFDASALAARIEAGDVVVSMVPAAMHPELLRLCIERRAHFVCSSYVSGELEAAAPAAAEAGIVAQVEAGLDPGIDHVLAHLLVAKGRESIGQAAPVSADFTSYCGGIPAEANEFRYRFSWAPRGVLMALRAPARYIEAGAERTIERPWEATSRRVLNGETFEVYPNRDSVPFVAQYGFPPSWHLDGFVRGTLRLDGWRNAWESVFAVLNEGDDERVNALADKLAARYPATESDLDRVILSVSLSLSRADDAEEWSGTYLLDMVGDQAESAMARCVSAPLACAITRILAGVSPPGLRRAAEDANEAADWLTFLRDHGIDCRFTEAPPSPSVSTSPSRGRAVR
jgi:hypothetical protein